MPEMSEHYRYLSGKLPDLDLTWVFLTGRITFMQIGSAEYIILIWTSSYFQQIIYNKNGSVSLSLK